VLRFQTIIEFLEMWAIGLCQD